MSLQSREEEDLITVPIYGGNRIDGQINQISKGVDILVATPGRLIDMLERRAVNLSRLGAICLDEADEMLNIGFK